MKVRPEGTGSSITTFVAMAGPAFVTVTVYLMMPPCWTLEDWADFVIETSAWLFTLELLEEDDEIDDDEDELLGQVRVASTV